MVFGLKDVKRKDYVILEVIGNHGYELWELLEYYKKNIKNKGSSSCLFLLKGLGVGMNETQKTVLPRREFLKLAGRHRR
jgi:hypothetical protein